MHANASISGILLAAGLGSRLGGGKLLLQYKGKPLLAHSLAAVLSAGGLARLILVLGNDAAPLTKALNACFPKFPPPGTEIVINSRPEWGMSESLRLGLSALVGGPETTGPRSVAVFLGDQPLIRPDTLRLLYAAHKRALAKNPRHPATAPEYRGRRGNPVILSRALLPSLLRLEGDAGARHILTDLGPRLLLLPVDDPGVVHDEDTPEAYEELRIKQT